MNHRYRTRVNALTNRISRHYSLSPHIKNVVYTQREREWLIATSDNIMSDYPRLGACYLRTGDVVISYQSNQTRNVAVRRSTRVSSSGSNRHGLTTSRSGAAHPSQTHKPWHIANRQELTWRELMRKFITTRPYTALRGVKGPMLGQGKTRTQTTAS